MAVEGRRISQGSRECMFKGNGRATLTILGYKHWKEFLKCNERELTPKEIDDLECAADYRNFGVDGVVKVEWPDVTVEFEMEKFLGRPTSSRKPMILSASQNFMALMHPFAVYKEWFKGFDSKDKKRLEGYEWVFEQDMDDYSYKGHIRKGREIFVTFEFAPDKEYHKLRI